MIDKLECKCWRLFDDERRRYFEVVQQFFFWSLGCSCFIEELWLQMLDDRNMTSHTYDEPTAKQIYENIQTYYPGLVKLADFIRRKYPQVQPLRFTLRICLSNWYNLCKLYSGLAATQNKSLFCESRAIAFLTFVTGCYALAHRLVRWW